MTTSNNTFPSMSQSAPIRHRITIDELTLKQRLERLTAGLSEVTEDKYRMSEINNLLRRGK